MSWPRWATVLTLGAAGVSVVVVGFWDEIVAGVRSDREMVTVAIDVPKNDRCDEAHPMRIQLKNGSRRTIRSVTLDVGIYERGDSRNLNNIYDWTMTDIVPPGDTSIRCYAFHERPKDPVVTARVREVYFYASEADVPK